MQTAAGWRGGLFLGAMLLSALPAGAQSVLFVEHEGKPAAVLAVHGGYARIRENGKVISVPAPRCGLLPAPEYYPAFVSIRNLDVSTSRVDLYGQGGTSEINNEFHLRANLSTTYVLHDVFLVLELNSERRGKIIFFHEVGILAPNQPQRLDLTVPMGDSLGDGHYILHVFTQGAEVFHSLIPDAVQEQKLTAMVHKRIASLVTAPPKPLFGPDPAYPEKLLSAKIKGTASVRIRITANGAVLDPVVESASDPAFGEAAVAAVRLWRFLPKMKDGHAQECKATLPFDFAPPGPDQKG